MWSVNVTRLRLRPYLVFAVEDGQDALKALGFSRVADELDALVVLGLDPGKGVITEHVLKELVGVGGRSGHGV